MSPTRELALQIAAEAERLVKQLRRPLEVHTAFGGTAKASKLTTFNRGDPKILVATPVSNYFAPIFSCVSGLLTRKASPYLSKSQDFTDLFLSLHYRSMR